jgi:hypothetical protein
MSFERIRRTVCSISPSSASEASSKSRWASSKKKTSLGFWRITDFRHGVPELSQQSEHERAEQLGFVEHIGKLHCADHSLA